MNLINEQSVTTSASTFTNEELSPAQTQFKSSLESAVEFVATTTETVGTAVASSSLLSSSTSSALSRSPSSLSLSFSTFSALSLPSSLSYSSSVRCSSPPTIESINRQIEKISNTISPPIDDFQINLIGKMPTTTTTTTIAKPAIITSGKTAVPSASPSSNTAANIMKAFVPLATTTTTVNIDNVNDVRDCIKNKNGDKKTDTTNPPSIPSTTTTTKSASALADRERKVGCEHYKRRAMFVTPCCNKFYKCRYCHDENETHHFDRKTLTELICIECNTRQAVQEKCEKCGVRFGKYTCLICNLFDDEDKNQYHCDGCGICRIGGRQNFFHCKVCNMCLPIELKIEGHRCVENISRSNCPVCLGAIHTSRIPCHIPDCGHLLHKLCFDQLLASGHYVCPTCQTSLLDMTKMWEYLDAQALLMAVPKKYENQRVYVFCNDCHETCKTKFHFVGLKCIHCGGYNTTQDVKRRMSWANDGTTSA